MLVFVLSCQPTCVPVDKRLNIKLFIADARKANRSFSDSVRPAMDSSISRKHENIFVRLSNSFQVAHY